LRTTFFRPILLLAFAATALLGGCSDFDEMKSQRQLIQAERLLEQGDELNAEQALSELIAKYPNTQAGDVAIKHLSRIVKQRERRERMAFAKILDSYRQVLDGYRALYAEYPKSASDLDQSDYFFDTSYLDQVTPEGYQVFLWLKSDGSGYRVWCIAPDKERGYAVEALNRNLEPFNRDEMLDTINMRYQSVELSGKLVALQEVQ
jgi:hypothetical protein